MTKDKPCGELIGRKIEEVRKSKGITQQHVCKMLAKDKSWLFRIEKGKQVVDAVEIKLIADVLGEPIDIFYLPLILTNGKRGVV